jgi:hypothetical protein
MVVIDSFVDLWINRILLKFSSLNLFNPSLRQAGSDDF